MSEAARHDDLLVLLDALREGEITAEQQAELDVRLATDEEARRVFVKYMDVVAELHWRAGEKRLTRVAEVMEEESVVEIQEAADGGSKHAATDTPRFSMATRHLAVGIAVAVSFVAMSLSLMHQILLPVRVAKQPEREERAPDNRAKNIESVARLVADTDAKWRGDVVNPTVDKRQRIKTGMRLYPGQKFVLTSGVAEFKFFNGAEVVLEGPAEFEVLGKKQCGLMAGKLVAKAFEERSKGFIVDTPAATFEDLGTEFGVSVRNGLASVRVFDGEVELATTGDDGETIRRVVVKDEAVDVSMAGGRPMIATSSDAKRAKFVRFLDARLPQSIIERLVATKDSVRGDFEGTVGYTFKVARPIVINALGVWDGPGHAGPAHLQRHIGDGLAVDARVGLWNDATGELLASAKVPAGGEAKAFGDFRYMPIGKAELRLEPGVEYCVGVGVKPGGNVFADNYQDVDPASQFAVRGGADVLRGVGSRFATKPFMMPSGEGPARSQEQFRWFIGPNAAYIEEFTSNKRE